MKNQVLSKAPKCRFTETLKNISQLLQQEEYKECEKILDAFDSSGFQILEEKIEILSLKGYLLSLQKKYQQALNIFNQCIQLRPYHLVSKKRRAIALQKLGEHQECLKQFKQCLWLQPESKSLRNKIKRLSLGSVKSQSASSEGNTLDEKWQTGKVGEQIPVQANKLKNNSVKFGNFEIIEVTGMSDSDERFAYLKQEIGKILDKKPIKSILKDSMSASILKQKVKQKEGEIEGKKVENAEQKGGEGKQKEGEKEKKQGSKKKAKSVTFKGDTNLQDFN